MVNPSNKDEKTLLFMVRHIMMQVLLKVSTAIRKTVIFTSIKIIWEMQGLVMRKKVMTILK